MGGKTIRDGMGESVKSCSKDGDLDLVITNALIVDSTGIVKADIGIKDGKIAGIGKAGNPDIMDGVTPGMTVGASTEALAGEGMIVTAGGIDTHIHFISPQQIDCALYSGVTTMIGGGTGPADGTRMKETTLSAKERLLITAPLTTNLDSSIEAILRGKVMVYGITEAYFVDPSMVEASIPSKGAVEV